MKLPRLHRKGRAYYHVTGSTPRQWTPLGSNLTAAVHEYRRIENGRSKAGSGPAIEAFLASKHDWTAGTRAQYRAYADHLIAVFGDMALGEITRAHVLAYLDGCVRTSARSEISLLRQVIERAVRRGEVTSNPCIGAKPENPARSKRTRLLSDAEFAAIKAKAAPVLAVAMDLAYLTAMRPGDLRALRRDNTAGHVRTQKTGARLRFTMTPELAAVFEAAHALSGKISTLTVLSERGRPLTRDRMRGLWERACKAAGVTNAQFRDIRAKSASDDPDEAQKRLGHSTAQTTRTYLRGREVIEVAPTRKRKT